MGDSLPLAVALAVAAVAQAPAAEEMPLPLAAPAPPLEDAPVAAPASPPPLWQEQVLSSPSAPPYDPGRASTLFANKCATCHGARGRGDGPAARFMTSPPRSFTEATYKVRSTSAGSVPTDADLFASISHGFPRAGMPSWNGLTESDRWQLVQHIKTLSLRFAAQPSGNVLVVPAPAPADETGVEKGRLAYVALRCGDCHGEDGRGARAAKLRDDRGRRAYPADLTRATSFKAGCTDTALFRTLMTGFDGTPMRSYADALSVKAAWALVAFLRSRIVDLGRC